MAKSLTRGRRRQCFPRPTRVRVPRGTTCAVGQQDLLRHVADPAYQRPSEDLAPSVFLELVTRESQKHESQRS
jgi:hypothetical protein